MGRAVVYLFLITAFAFFFVFYPSNSPDRNHQELTRRLGYKLRAPTFDPLVEEMERYAEEHGSGRGRNAISGQRTTTANQVPDAYKDYYDEGRLKISLRLLVLFPLLDHSPKDGVISYEELSDWIIEQAVQRLNYRTRKELDFHDKNGDGAISFREYLPQFTEEDIGMPLMAFFSFDS